jgi:hypothetical protein
MSNWSVPTRSAHRGHLDDVSVLERGDQRDHPGDREMDLVHRLARLEEHRPDRQVDRRQLRQDPLARLAGQCIQDVVAGWLAGSVGVQVLVPSRGGRLSPRPRSTHYELRSPISALNSAWLGRLT